jgi:putative DNA primase/helicase
MKNHESHPTGIADLHQRRIAVAMETGMGRRMDETLVKQLTGGDPIKARRMREDFWTFYPTHKLWLVSNHRPNVRDLGVAFWRRIHLVPFTVQIPPKDQDPELPAKLLRESVGILRWMVEGCLAWQQRGLDVPPAVEVATNEYREDTDWLGAWIEACCEEDARATSTFEELFGSFKEWSQSQSQGLRNLNPQEFGGVLTDRGYGKKKSNGKTYRLGLQLKEGQRTVQRRIVLGA